jgi:hypothetical protein
MHQAESRPDDLGCDIYGNPWFEWEGTLDRICRQLSEPEKLFCGVVPERLMLEAEEELVDALYAHPRIDSYLLDLDAQVRASKRKYTSGPKRQALRRRMVLAWWKKWLSHSELTHTESVWLVTLAAAIYVEAERRKKIIERRERGESQRALAREHGMSRWSVAQLGANPEPGEGINLSEMTKTEVEDLYELVRSAAEHGTRDALVGFEAEKLQRELEQYLEDQD